MKLKWIALVLFVIILLGVFFTREVVTTIALYAGFYIAFRAKIWRSGSGVDDYSVPVHLVALATVFAGGMIFRPYMLHGLVAQCTYLSFLLLISMIHARFQALEEAKPKLRTPIMFSLALTLFASAVFVFLT